MNVAPRFRGSFDHVLEAGSYAGRSVPAPVLIVVPGRDEAAHIGETLPELCGQDQPGVRVVFVDDASSDGTPEITAGLRERHGNLTVVRNEGEPPAGWVGKCWAVVHGLAAVGMFDAGQGLDEVVDEGDLRLIRGATGGEAEGGPAAGAASAGVEWLCFTDADIHWDPRCLRSALCLAEETGADVVGLFPGLRFGSFVEALVLAQLALALGLFFPIPRSMDPAYEDVLIGGGFILVRRGLYESIGGHVAVKGEVVEDINLGRKLKAAGGRVRLAFAEGLLWCRMYEGWGDLWEGLTKNAYAGLDYRWWKAGLLFPVLGVTNVLPPVVVLGSVWCWAVGPGWVSGAAVLVSVLGWLLTARPMNAVRKRLRLAWWHAWLMPAGSAVYLGILAGSMWRYYRGGSVWKGRRYGASGE